MLTSGTLTAARSAPGELHRLVLVPILAADATTGLWPIPVARSYDGFPWEALYPQAGQSRVAISCDATACTLAIPSKAPSGFAYRFEVLNASTVEGLRGVSSTRQRRRAAAKFLTHATFGPKREELDSMADALASSSEGQVFGDWVHEQLALPASLHRAHYRERLNSRTHAGRLACEPGSRWHTYAFTTLDVAARVNITVTLDAAGVRSIFVGNVLRTQVPDFTEFDPANVLGVTVTQPWFGYLCRVGERVGGFFTTSWGWHHRGGIGLDTSSACVRNAANHLQFWHPRVHFVSPDPSTTLIFDADEATLEPVPWIGRTNDLGRGAYFLVGGPYVDSNAPLTYEEVVVMTERRGPCPLSHANQQQRGHAFMVYNGTAYMHDPRIVLFNNTLESTSDPTLLGDESSGRRAKLGACRNVPKTFQNAHTCRPSAACSPVTYRDASVLLNHSSLRTFHELTSAYVYAIEGLRLDPSAASPCVGTARWRKLSEGPCGASATALDDATKATLAQAIRGSTDASNPLVRDAIPNTVVGGTCVESHEGVSSVGAKVDVDGSCWEHSHPFYWNVYEMDEWAAEHPGNLNFAPDANPIKAVARRGETVLAFPASHPMSRLASALPSFALLGKLGDEVSFRNLPTSVQNADVAAAFDALLLGGVSESCGSPGEVANDPLAGNIFRMQSGSEGAVGGLEQTYYALDNGYRGMGHIVHFHLAMHAADQLRQRAAHALIQVYVLSFLGTDHNWNSEIFIHYYDILVRNAFGSLHTILKEVSYNGLMASYLTYQDSASLASTGVLPDENYARESMQLFSVGLIELTDDGQYQLDHLGNPIETYDTEDIGEFAKCWTGFSLPSARSNVDIEGHSRGNRIDPMRIRGNGADAKRDLFPKTNLYNGHLGDGYPLCADLGSRHFLSKGARWSYLGHSASARLQPEALHEQTKWHLHNLGVTQYRFGVNWDWEQDDGAIGSLPRLRPNASASRLYRALCNNAEVGSPCDFRSEIYLPETLPCDGDECHVDTVAVADIFDPRTNRTVYYEYVRRACVELTFFEPVTIQGNNVRQPNGLQMCADPATEVAAAGCCPPDHVAADNGVADCKYMNEVMSYGTAVERCAARTDGYTLVCPERWAVPGCFGTNGNGALDERSWLRPSANATACAINVQVRRACRVLHTACARAVGRPCREPPVPWGARAVGPQPARWPSNARALPPPAAGDAKRPGAADPRGEHRPVAHAGLAQPLPRPVGGRALPERRGRDVHHRLHRHRHRVVRLHDGRRDGRGVHRDGHPPQHRRRRGGAPDW